MAKWILGRGIKCAFGIIGGGNVALWEAIARTECRLVCTHHEQAATMAASYYARSTGRIGLALVTTGAGSSNAITGVLAAWMDGTPLLIISGNEPYSTMNKATRVWGVQGYDSSGTASHFSKYARRISSADHALAVLEQAADFALAAPQGPVWVDLPKDLQLAAV